MGESGRKQMNISERQYGFQPGKSTSQPLFCLRMLQEKQREFGKELHVVFVDLEKAYDSPGTRSDEKVFQRPT